MAVRFKFVSSFSWTPQKSSESFSWPGIKGSVNVSALFFNWLKQIGQDASKGVHAWWKQWKQASEKWQGLATVLVRHHSRWGEAFIGNCASKVGRYYFGFFGEVHLLKSRAKQVRINLKGSLQWNFFVCEMRHCVGRNRVVWQGFPPKPPSYMLEVVGSGSSPDSFRGINKQF